MRASNWNTYRTTCYTYDVGGDPRSQGGVHHHQVCYRGGVYRRRIVQSNGRFTSVGPTDRRPAASRGLTWSRSIA